MGTKGLPRTGLALSSLAVVVGLGSTGFVATAAADGLSGAFGASTLGSVQPATNGGSSGDGEPQVDLSDGSASRDGEPNIDLGDGTSSADREPQVGFGDGSSPGSATEPVQEASVDPTGPVEPPPAVVGSFVPTTF